MVAGPFEPWVILGYTPDLLPVARRGSSTAPESRLKPDDLGKTPTVPTDDGWVGAAGFTRWRDVSRETILKWQHKLHGQPCNVGLNSRVIHGLDVDTVSQEFAIRTWRTVAPLAAAAALGVRVGRAPGYLVPFRPATPRRKLRYLFIDTRDASRHLVELCAEGQQFVIDGINRTTGQPYTWHPDATTGAMLTTTPYNRVAVVADELFDSVWRAVPLAFEGTPWTLASASAPHKLNGHDTPPPPEELLAPSIAHVVEALRWLPNKPGDGRDRDDWIKVGLAVASATAKSAEGWEAWLSWSDQWDSSEAAQAHAEKSWQSFDPATSHIGYRWLAERARIESCGRCTLQAELDFNSHLEEADAGLAVPDDAELPVVREKPTREELAAAIEALTPNGNALPVLQLMAKATLSRSESHPFLVQIKERTKVPLEALRSDYAKALAAAVHFGTSDVGQRLADLTASHLGAAHIGWHHGSFWKFQAPVWLRSDGIEFADLMKTAFHDDPTILLGPDSRQKNLDNSIAQAMSLLRIGSAKNLVGLDDPDHVMRPALNLANGTLWMNGSGNTLTRHNPADCFTWFADIDYDPRATCPRYDATLADMLSRTSYTLDSGDPDYAEVRDRVTRAEATENNPVVLEDGRRCWHIGSSYHVADIADNARMVNETLGYLMQPQRCARQVFIWVGNGSNGKSGLAKLLTARLGAAVVNMAIDQFERSDFIWSFVPDKLVLLVEDMRHRLTLRDDVCKLLSTNSVITANRKYEAMPVTFTNTAAILALTNNLPATADLSAGMVNRVTMLPFNRTYTEAEWPRDPWPSILADRREMSGILNRWLAAQHAVLERRHVKLSRASIELHEKWLQRQMPEQAFIFDVCMTVRPVGDKHEGESLENLYNAFASWFTAAYGGNRQHMRGRNVFSEILQRLGFHSYVAKGYTRFRGLWLHPDRTSKDFGSVVFLDPRRDDAEDE